MVTCTQISKDALIVGRWYAGRGRNANIGMWNGEDFLVLAEVGQKVGPGPREWVKSWGVKREPYFQADGGCFQPFKMVDMGTVSVPQGEGGYALEMSFDSSPESGP
ncbi:hypothetical protein DBV10_00470 [Acidovorax sp. FJL06]|nr:hypothetical protein DBV10_00470 [Acidovorax sp. FJL06]